MEETWEHAAPSHWVLRILLVDMLFHLLPLLIVRQVF